MARRSASARPGDLCFASAPIAVVMSFTVAALSTSQCEASSARLQQLHQQRVRFAE
jgi:hypothetical protein